jgi:S1-C subfamily serine protease
MTRLKQILGAGAVMLGLAIATPSAAWEVESMNKQVDETNFIVSTGCSGTLISKEYRLILTAYHCINQFVKRETKDVIGEDGAIERTQFEKLVNVRISQVDYHDFDKVGAVSYQTRIVAKEKRSDIAILQLIGTKLRSSVAAPIRASDLPILRGEPVIAVGNPRGLDATVTGGIVTSTTRKIDWIGGMTPMIQTDAMAAPGSSGGALYDNDGYLIGIVVGGRQGEFALAIPVNLLYSVLDEACFGSVYDKNINDELCRNPVEEEDIIDD